MGNYKMESNNLLVDFDDSVDRHQLGVDRHHLQNRPATIGDFNKADLFYSSWLLYSCFTRKVSRTFRWITTRSFRSLRRLSVLNQSSRCTSWLSSLQTLPTLSRGQRNIMAATTWTRFTNQLDWHEECIHDPLPWWFSDRITAEETLFVFSSSNRRFEGSLDQIQILSERMSPTWFPREPTHQYLLQRDSLAIRGSTWCSELL